jgi:hypothetical protein
MWKTISFAALVVFASGIVAALADDKQTCLGRDVLLQRLAQVPGIEAMTDDELRAIYCEGMAGAFQKSIDVKKNAGTPVAQNKEAPLAIDTKTA